MPLAPIATIFYCLSHTFFSLFWLLLHLTCDFWHGESKQNVLSTNSFKITNDIRFSTYKGLASERQAMRKNTISFCGPVSKFILGALSLANDWWGKS